MSYTIKQFIGDSSKTLSYYYNDSSLETCSVVNNQAICTTILPKQNFTINFTINSNDVYYFNIKIASNNDEMNLGEFKSTENNNIFSIVVYTDIVDINKIIFESSTALPILNSQIEIRKIKNLLDTSELYIGGNKIKELIIEGAGSAQVKDGFIINHEPIILGAPKTIDIIDDMGINIYFIGVYNYPGYGLGTNYDFAITCKY